MNQADFTPTQWRIVQFLTDGRPHSREELCRLLEDPGETNKGAVRVHVHYVRKAVRRYGYDLTTTRVHQTCYYRMVRTVARPDS